MTQLSEYSLSYSVGVTSKHPRAKPLPPEDRRQAIAHAIVPLLLHKGATVTSKEMAEAAGVAEGTIFSVFEDKHAVINEALKSSMDPTFVCDALGNIPETAPLQQQLETAATVLVERSEKVAALVGILRSGFAPHPHGPAGPPGFVVESNRATLAALTRLLSRHSERLTIDPDRAALAFRGIVFANSHPIVGPDEKLRPGEIVNLLLHGIAATDTESSTRC